MLLIMDIIPLLKVLKTFKGTCDTCQCEGTIELVKTCQCFRLFFIPLLKWKTKYFLKHSCGGEVIISEEVAIGILHGTISIEAMHIEHQEVNQHKCLQCGQYLEYNFEYCPYCGFKRGRIEK